tara:strand:- start:2845 stop:3948 length:1104 start_codon:yes stop_codon:yes gene_type:complete
LYLYWILILITAWRALVKPRCSWSIPTSLFVWIILVVLIGLRDGVGGDWNTYERYYRIVNDPGWQFESTAGSLAYDYLNRLAGFYFFKGVSDFGNGIFLVNTIAAAIFSGGLVWFCRSTPRPWLALTTAIPYLVIVVGMGYTKQSIALGILFFGFDALANGFVWRYFIFIFFAGCFHFSSFVALPLVIPYINDSNKVINKIITVLFLILTAVIMSLIFLANRWEFLLHGYFVDEYSSSGAYIRVALNLLPSLLFLLYGYRLDLNKNAILLWKTISIFTIICFVGLFVLPSTTVIDRLALYAIPIQLFVLSRLPDFKIFKYSPQIINFAVVSYSFALLFVWLYYGNYSSAWADYRNLLFTWDTFNRSW